MTWETIKRKAIQEFISRVGGANQGLIGLGDSSPFLALLAQIERYTNTGSFKPATEILREWQDWGIHAIENWDVRCVGKLIELFPSCVPTHWHGRKLECWIEDNENCEWMVAPAEGRQ